MNTRDRNTDRHSPRGGSFGNDMSSSPMGRWRGVGRINYRSSFISNKTVIVQVLIVDLKVDLVYLHLIIMNQEDSVVDLLHALHRHYYKSVVYFFGHSIQGVVTVMGGESIACE